MYAAMYRPASRILSLNPNLNPNTGDPNAGLIWIVLAALVVSAVVIVVLVATGKKKRK